MVSGIKNLRMSQAGRDPRFVDPSSSDNDDTGYLSNLAFMKNEKKDLER